MGKERPRFSDFLSLATTISYPTAADVENMTCDETSMTQLAHSSSCSGAFPKPPWLPVPADCRMLSGTVNSHSHDPPAFTIGSNSGTPYLLGSSNFSFGSKLEGQAATASV